jgi:hypothetical protein
LNLHLFCTKRGRVFHSIFTEFGLPKQIICTCSLLVAATPSGLGLPRYSQEDEKGYWVYSDTPSLVQCSTCVPVPVRTVTGKERPLVRVQLFRTESSTSVPELRYFAPGLCVRGFNSRRRYNFEIRALVGLRSSPLLSIFFNNP